jgi:hypothetical protein
MQVTFTANSHIVSDRLQDDVIVIDVVSGAYYALTDAGSRAWTRAVGVGPLDIDPDDAALGLLAAFETEGLVTGDPARSGSPVADPSEAFTKYVDLADLLLADPIHEVDPSGWPELRTGDAGT